MDYCVEPGEYWVYEKTPPKGFAHNTTMSKFSVNAGETKTVDKNVIGADSALDNMPLNDPGMLIIRKLDKNGKVVTDLSDIPQGNASLVGVEYTLKFYDGDTATGDPLKTVTVRSKSGNIINFARSDTFEIVSGDWWLDGLHDSFVFYLGTVILQETKAPEGYRIDNTLYTIQIVEDTDPDSFSGVKFVVNGTDSFVLGTSGHEATPTISHYEESVFLGGVSVRKVDSVFGVEGKPMGDATLAGRLSVLEKQ